MSNNSRIRSLFSGRSNSVNVNDDLNVNVDFNLNDVVDNEETQPPSQPLYSDSPNNIVGCRIPERVLETPSADHYRNYNSCDAVYNNRVTLQSEVFHTEPDRVPENFVSSQFPPVTTENQSVQQPEGPQGPQTPVFTQNQFLQQPVGAQGPQQHYFTQNQYLQPVGAPPLGFVPYNYNQQHVGAPPPGFAPYNYNQQPVGAPPTGFAPYNYNQQPVGAPPTGFAPYNNQQPGYVAFSFNQQPGLRPQPGLAQHVPSVMDCGEGSSHRNTSHQMHPPRGRVTRPRRGGKNPVQPVTVSPLSEPSPRSTAASSLPAPKKRGQILSLVMFGMYT